MLRSFMALPPSGHSMANGTPNNVSEIFGMCWPTNLTVCNMKMPPVLCCIVFLFVSMLSAVARQQEKPRVIVTTDGEIDDQSSMIRFLMYSSDYDVAGLSLIHI